MSEPPVLAMTRTRLRARIAELERVVEAARAYACLIPPDRRVAARPEAPLPEALALVGIMKALDALDAMGEPR